MNKSKKKSKSNKEDKIVCTFPYSAKGRYSCPVYISNPNFCLRFPDKRETLSLDDGFDQTPVLKDILDYYVINSKPLVDIVSVLGVDTRAQKNKLRAAYFKVAPAVVSVSSFVGVQRKIDCSGLVINWSSSENEATILTSSKLLWSPKGSTAEFHLIVRMPDGQLLLAKEDYVDYYHNLLTLKVMSTVEPNVVDLRSMQSDIVEDIVEGMNVIALGRCFYTYSLCDYTGELYMEHPCFGCDELLRSTCCVSEICEGGPLITDTGYVVGINFLDDCGRAHPLPTQSIVTCLDMWSSFGIVLRPWFGMSVIDVDQLSYQILEKLKISLQEPFVVVKKVYKGSLADKKNVRSGDSVAIWNGIPIESAKQYSQLLSESSLQVSSFFGSGFSHERSTVVIKPYDRRADDIFLETDYLSVDSESFYDCWFRIEAADWSREKLGSQKNPGFSYFPFAEKS